jgi:hypothetical protein
MLPAGWRNPRNQDGEINQRRKQKVMQKRMAQRANHVLRHIVVGVKTAYKRHRR